MTGHIIRICVVKSAFKKKKNIFDIKRVFGSSLQYYFILFLSVRTEQNIATHVIRSSCKVPDIFVRH